MPLKYERPFRVRQYECDPYGHLNHASYLRFMETAAIEASAAAGYDTPQYVQLGLTWHIRKTQIDYLRPVKAGDSLLVTTWVADFRRVQSRRMYAFRRAGQGDPVAEAYSDWVLLDVKTGRPTTVPKEMIAAFFPNDTPPQAPRRQPFPTSPAPPPGAFQMSYDVAWRDLDTAGHVNNANYLSFMESAGMGVLAAYGWPPARCAAAGFLIVARRFQLEYRQPAGFGQRLHLSTWVSDVRRATAVRHYTVTRPSDDAQIARGRGLWVWIDANTGQPRRIPPSFLADFAPNVAPAL